MRSILGPFGYSYYIFNGELHACPTNADGSLDEENDLPVSDFAEPISEPEKQAILKELSS